MRPPGRAKEGAKRPIPPQGKEKKEKKKKKEKLFFLL
jgi:hypothetical protein